MRARHDFVGVALHHYVVRVHGFLTVHGVGALPVRLELIEHAHAHRLGADLRLVEQVYIPVELVRVFVFPLFLVILTATLIRDVLANFCLWEAVFQLAENA